MTILRELIVVNNFLKILLPLSFKITERQYSSGNGQAIQIALVRFYSCQISLWADEFLDYPMDPAIPNGKSHVV